MPLVRRALKVLSDREVSPQLGLLKSTLLQLDSTFSERTYGVGSFRDFAQKLAAAGHVTAARSGPERARRARRGRCRRAADDAGAAPHRAAPERARRREPRDRVRRARAVGSRHRRAAAGRRAARGRRHPRGAPAVPVGAESAALADVHPSGEAVHAQRRSDVRRAQVRLRAASSICCAPASATGCSASSATVRASCASSRATSCRWCPSR